MLQASADMCVDACLCVMCVMCVCVCVHVHEFTRQLQGLPEVLIVDEAEQQRPVTPKVPRS